MTKIHSWQSVLFLGIQPMLFLQRISKNHHCRTLNDKTKILTESENFFRDQICDAKSNSVWCCRDGDFATPAELKELNEKNDEPATMVILYTAPQNKQSPPLLKFGY